MTNETTGIPHLEYSGGSYVEQMPLLGFAMKSPPMKT